MKEIDQYSPEQLGWATWTDLFVAALNESFKGLSDIEATRYINGFVKLGSYLVDETVKFRVLRFKELQEKTLYELEEAFNEEHTVFVELTSTLKSTWLTITKNMTQPIKANLLPEVWQERILKA